jgi:hypothetical protein
MIKMRSRIHAMASTTLIPNVGTDIHQIPKDLLAKTHEHLDTSTTLESDCDLVKTHDIL